jgi:pantoate--beta-alanine ligase
VPTIRSADGLALSSRNRYLTTEQHRQALGLHAGLSAAAAAYASGERDPARLVSLARGPMQVEPEYLELRRDDLSAYVAGERAVLLAAARFGSTRLIDNVVLEGE